ncbi:amidohydrolase family protein [Myxococcota bacterium]|nr:amidohydrolase family protein [Myxococcota bacterium]
MAEGRTLFKGANLFDGRNAPTPNMNVVVSGRRIESVSKEVPPTAEGDRVVDLAGRTLMPGMVQGHFHACFGSFGSGAPAPVLGLEAPATFLGMLGAHNARILLNCGFTGAVGSSNPYGLDVSLKEAIAYEFTDGPRLLACTREYVTSGDAADGTNRSWYMELGNTGLIRRVDGADAYRQAAREDFGRGADVVKLSAGPGHGSHPATDFCYLTRAELDAVVGVAHDQGKLVRAHCPSRSAIMECADAGVDIIDHADRMDEACIEAICRAGATVLPSMLWSATFLGLAENWDYAAQPFPIGSGFPEPLEETHKRIRGVREDFEHTCRMLPELVKSGARIVIGDDFGTAIMRHGDYVNELELYVKELGIDAFDVLRWATYNGWDLMGMSDELGSVEAGKLADLVVVDGNPVADISCLKGPLVVMKDGVFVKDQLN